jgi:hypothetical protein
MELNHTVQFTGFSGGRIQPNNCSNCRVFESNHPETCPLFTVKPTVPKPGDMVDLGKQKGLASMYATISFVMKCEYHISQDTPDRENRVSKTGNGRFDTLDLEGE